jgi:KDO2-lipid IV(A) lauroyltransferase
LETFMMQRSIGMLLRLLARLPWRVLHALGRFAGWLLYRLDGREARNVRANLGIAYPDMARDRREALLRESLLQSALTYAEMPRIWLSAEDLSYRVDPNGLPQTMRRLVARGNGLILAMPHHGNWEMVSSAIDQSLRITGLYRPPRQPWLEPLMTEGRSIARIHMVPTSRSGIKALHQALQAGDVVAILPDQVPKAAGAAATAAPFFGRDCATMVLLGRLASRHRSPVLFVYALRQPDGRYRAEYFEAEPAVSDSDPLIAATALNRSVERCISAAPAQYQWAYRRFSPVLPGQRNPYR